MADRFSWKKLGALAAIAVACVSVTAASATAQTRTADEQAIRQRLATYAKARTDKDAHTEALCYTEDGDFRSSAGPFVTGRAAIEKQLTVTDPTYQFALDVQSIRFLDAQVAVVEAVITAGPAGRGGKLVGTYVMVKQNGDWLIGAARIATAPRPPAPAAAPAQTP